MAAAAATAAPTIAVTKPLRLAGVLSSSLMTVS
jgi:hypothetical protein